MDTLIQRVTQVLLFRFVDVSIDYDFSTSGVRSAIAKKFSLPNITLKVEDVVITNACSGALELAFGVLAGN